MIGDNIEIVLLISGLLTASMIIQYIAPQYALNSFFAKEVKDPYTLFLASSSGMPIAMIGLLMIWASADEAIRLPVVIVAVLGKIGFLIKILFNRAETGSGYNLTIGVDGITVSLLLLYIAGF